MSGTSFVADLRSVLAERDFRRLFATRLVSQTGDGVFTAGLGSYVFFTATKFPNPASAAVAFAVLYLPYSLIGPFAGVFIDRWSRRQILVRSALLRAVFVVLTASLVASGNLGVPLYAAVLAVLGVNRFFLSSLSAALPHVVAEDKLVMANSVAPTAGGIMGSVGGVLALGAHVATGGSERGSAITLLAGGCCYLLSGLVGATMPRDLLGPIREPGQPRPGRLTDDLIVVAVGFAAGARYVSRRRGSAAALGATGGQRLAYGMLFLVSILLYRNYFYRVAGANVALGNYLMLVVASAVGYASAAVVTPIATRRLAKPGWIITLLASGAALAGGLGTTFDPIAFLFLGFGLNLVLQGVAICVVTILQEDVDDSYRGRVFAFYDVLYNVTFVAGAAVAAVVVPVTGKSYPILAVAAACYLIAALGYFAASRQDLLAGPSPASSPPPPPGPGEPGAPPPDGLPPGPESPSATAHRSSS